LKVEVTETPENVSRFRSWLYLLTGLEEGRSDANGLIEEEFAVELSVGRLFSVE
jgi:hypothetical protein